MNSSMDTKMWKTTHRFGALMLGLLALFAAWEVAHDEALTSMYRVGGASLLAAAGLLALVKWLRPGGRDEQARATVTRRHQRQRS